jgi:hypothetical protein
MRLRLSILLVFLLLETQQINAQALSFLMILKKIAEIASALGDTADGLTKLYKTPPIKHFIDSKQLQTQLNVLSQLTNVSADITDLSFLIPQYQKTPSDTNWSAVTKKLKDAILDANGSLSALNAQSGAFLLPAPDLDARLKGILEVKSDILGQLVNMKQPQSAAERTALRSLADSLTQENVQLSEALKAITGFLAQANGTA